MGMVAPLALPSSQDSCKQALPSRPQKPSDSQRTSYTSPSMPAGVRVYTPTATIRFSQAYGSAARQDLAPESGTFRTPTDSGAVEAQATRSAADETGRNLTGSTLP